MAKNTIEVKLLGDNKDLASKLNASESKLGKFAKTAGKVGALAVVAAGAGLVKLGMSLDSALDNIVVGTGATGDALEGLKTDFEAVSSSVPSSFGDVSTAIADVNTRLGLTGKPLQDLSTQFLDLSRLTGTDLSANISNMTRVFGDAGVAAEDQGLALDKLFTASQSSGISLDALSTTLVNFGAPMRQLGFSLDESTALLAKFDKEGVNTNAVLAGMKAGLGKMAKAGEDPIETFERVTESIKNAGTQGEANAIALEAFGQRAGPDMAAAIREGRFEIDDMLGVLGDAEGSIGDTAAATESWTEKLKILANKGMIKLAPLAEKAFGAVGKGVAFVTPHLERFGEWLGDKIPPIVADLRQAFDDNWPKIQATIEKVVAWVETNLVPKFKTAFSAVVDGFRTVVDFFNNNRPVLVTVLGVIAGAFVLWGIAAAGAAASTLLAVSPIVLLVAAVAAIAGALVYAYTNFEGFRNVVDGVVSFLTGTVWPAIQDFADFVGDVFTATVGFIRKHWSTIQSVIKGVWDFVAKYVENVIKIVQGIIQTVTSIIKGDWGRAWDGIKKIFSGVWDQIKHVVSAAIGVVKSVLSAAWPVIRSVLASAWDAMKRKVSDTISGIVGYVRALPGRARDALSSILSTLVGKGKDLITGLKNGMIDKFNDTRAWVGQIPSRILGAISGAYTLLGSVGRNIIIGLKNGMIGKWNEVTAWIRSRISSLSSIARKVLGINSPSKVFAKIGEGVGEGMVMGLDSMTGKVQNAASKMMPTASDLATSVEFGASRLAPAHRSPATTNATSPQGRPIVLNLAGMAQIKAIVSESDAELLATLEGGLR